MKFSGKTIAALGVVALAVALPVIGEAAAGRDKYESARYRVESDAGEFEIRAYVPRVVAQVEVVGDALSASNKGFRILAGYIFGDNVAKVGVEMTTPVERRRAQNIEMTTPVDRKRQGERWVVTFTMPEQYELETLPEPLDERVQLREEPVRRFAVTRFSGAPSEREVQRRMQELALAVNEAGLTTTGEPPVYSRYDPPWTLPFRRRNEIMLELALSGPVSD